MRRRHEQAQKIRAPKRQHDSTGATRGRQQQAFHEQLANQASAAGTERRAHRDFLFTRRGASQQQICHVDAGDQQHQHGYDHQESQHATEKILHAVMGLPYGRHIHTHAVADVGIGIFLRQMPRDGGEFRLRLCDRHARAKASQDVHESWRAFFDVLEREHFRLHHHRHEILRVKPTIVPKKCGGATPITVNGCPLMWTVRPTTLGSEPNSRFQSLG